jgi:eukaryotic-like serine/threonine-protein kinase
MPHNALHESGDSDSDAWDTMPGSDVEAPAARLGINETTRIERYRLVRRIGQGGMGEVWEAEQLEPVLRRVAIKIIKLGMDTEEVVRRFDAERQALALMEHPGIARVFDAGATEAGRPYFAMELAGGEILTDYCDRLRLGGSGWSYSRRYATPCSMRTRRASFIVT